jgi:hypothetical protein
MRLEAASPVEAPSRRFRSHLNISADLLFFKVDTHKDKDKDKDRAAGFNR